MRGHEFEHGKCVGTLLIKFGAVFLLEKLKESKEFYAGPSSGAVNRITITERIKEHYLRGTSWT